MSEVLTPVLYQLGIGGIGGLIAGYAIKKLSKLIAVIVGIFILALIYLSYIGVISINYTELSNQVSKLIGLTGEAGNLITPIVSHLPFAASFIVGFVIGFKKG